MQVENTARHGKKNFLRPKANADCTKIRNRFCLATLIKKNNILFLFFQVKTFFFKFKLLFLYNTNPYFL